MDIESDPLLNRNSILKEFALKEFAFCDDSNCNPQSESNQSDLETLNKSQNELADRISQINFAIELLGGELRRLVADNYEQFIERSGSCSLFQKPLQQLNEFVVDLQTSLQRLKQSLGQPYEQIASRMQLLTRLQITCDLMRALIRIVGIGKRLLLETDTGDFEQLIQKLNDSNTSISATELNLETLNSGIRDLSRQAGAAAEMLQTRDDYPRVQEIHVVQDLLQLAEQKRTYCERLAVELLNLSLKLQESQLATGALMILHTLDRLQSTIDAMTRQKLQIIQDSLNKFGDEKLNATRLWPTIEQFVKCLLVQNAHMIALARILKRRRDLLPNSLSSTESNAILNVDIEFAKQAASLALNSLQSKASRHILLKDALEGQFPKLLRLFVDLQPISSESIDTRRQFHLLLAPFEAAYLSRSLSSLIDSVDLVFGENKKSDSGSSSAHSDCLIMRKDIDALIHQLHTQLLVLRLDEPLGKLVTRNVCQTVNLFLTKSEQLVRVSGDATQVLGPASSAQKANAQLLDRLVHFESKLLHILEDVSQSGARQHVLKSLNDKVSDIHVLMKNILQPLQDSILDAVDSIFLTMHSENLINNSNEGQCSLYMKELTGFMLRVQSDYLRLLPRHSVLSDCIRSIGARLIYSGLEQISLIRVPSEGPAATGTRLRLAADLAQLDKCVTGLSQATALGKPMRALRAVRRLLLAPADQLVDSHALCELLPHWLTIQLLIGWFAPHELRLSHEQKGWSISRFTKWLEQHPEEQDRLLLIRDSLESYVQLKSRQTNFTQFPGIYTVIRSLLEEGLKLTAKTSH